MLGSVESLYDLVRSQQHRLRDRQAEPLRGFEIDHQLELRWLLHRQIARLCALEDLVDKDRGAPEQVRQARAIRYRDARVRKLSQTTDRGQTVLCRQIGQ